MLVFGDPGDDAVFGDLVEGLLSQCKSVACQSLDDVRRLMIRAGQIEQGVSDFPASENEWVCKAQAVTEATAALFCGLFGSDRNIHFSPELRKIERAIQELRDEASALWGARLRIKAPEGFAFYRLYPEQYIVAAERWDKEHSADGVTVIGVRSIGTTLSAVVMETLKRRQLQIRRFTVRPSEHPFDRVCRISPEVIQGVSAALIVDEGPGASGSSMASVAKGLVDVGMNPSAIFFFPGHSNLPGPAASAEVRDWWNRIESCVTPARDVVWNGETIERLLLRKSNELSDCDEEFVRLQDVGCGKWRGFVFRNESEWPSVCLNFERTKYVCSTAAGKRILWKFNGLQGQNMDPEADGRVRCARRLGTSRGFTGFEWVEGMRFSEESGRDRALLERCASYVAGSGGPQLSKSAGDEARIRLEEMLYWNTKEALGDDVAEQTRHIAKNLCFDGLPSYRDGRMAPYEWVVGSKGELYKITDYTQPRDHTIVGRQSILWDVAGFIIEWNLEDEAVRIFLEAVRTHGLKVEIDELRFYLAAYVAFRVGQTSVCASLYEHDCAELERLHCSNRRYRAQLERILV